MDELNITQAEDGTLTLVGELADPVLCSPELWAMLIANESVITNDEDPAGTIIRQIIAITTDRWFLQYEVLRSSDDGRVLGLRSWSERPAT